MTPTLETHDNIAVLTLGDTDNRFSPDWLDTVNAHLDQVETTARALVTVGAGKFYSNGLDLDWLLSNNDRAEWYVDQVQALFNRILTFSLPTAAAINGHAFGAGAMFAIAHDFRTMREDRGYFCFPEVDINIPFTPGMSALIQAKLSPDTAMVAMTTGHRYGGAEALAAGLVTATAPEGEVVPAALDRLSTVAGKDRGTVGAVKTTMFASVSAALQRGRV